MPKIDVRARLGQSRPAWRWGVVIALLVAAGCTTGEKMADMRDGMSKDQVVATLGRPDGYSRTGNTEVLTYANRLVSGWDWDRADYRVSLSDGRVTAYGPGPILYPPSEPLPR